MDYDLFWIDIFDLIFLLIVLIINIKIAEKENNWIKELMLIFTIVNPMLCIVAYNNMYLDISFWLITLVLFFSFWLNFRRLRG